MMLLKRNDAHRARRVEWPELGVQRMDPLLKSKAERERTRALAYLVAQGWSGWELLFKAADLLEVWEDEAEQERHRIVYAAAHGLMWDHIYAKLDAEGFVMPDGPQDLAHVPVVAGHALDNC